MNAAIIAAALPLWKAVRQDPHSSICYLHSTLSMPNDYDQLSAAYQDTDQKPDKKYSILPTVLALAGDVHGKTVLDLGCGSGFFTTAFAKQGAQVIGVDNSKEQLRRAIIPDNAQIEYRLVDIFNDPLPEADIINAPFVLNYTPNSNVLRTCMQKIFSSLRPGGTVVIVSDIPSIGPELKKYGSYKTTAEQVDGAPLTVELYNNEELICTLHSTYYSPETIQQMLQDCGFTDVIRHAPIVSDEGIQKFGNAFWDTYMGVCDLMYFTGLR